MSNSYLSRVRAHRQRARVRANRCLRFENLEGRAMMSASPLSIANQQIVGPVVEAPTVRIASSAAATAATQSAGQQERALAATNQLLDGGIVTGRIRTVQQKDQWFFRTNGPNEVVELASSYTTGNSELRVTVFNPRGQIVSQWRGPDSKRIKLSDAGQYRVQVQDGPIGNTAKNLGAYKIGFERVSRPSADAKSLSEGGIVTGRISESFQKDQYTFRTTTNNEVVELATRFTTGNSELRVTVFNSQGAVVREWRGWQNIRLTLPSAGRYLVQVQDSQLLNMGSYRIGFERISPPSRDARSLVAGAAVVGRIQAPMQKDQFIIQTTQNNQAVEIRGRYTTGNSELRIIVFDARGAVVRDWRGSNSVRLTLPSAGRYLIQVQDAALLNAGSYDLMWRRV